MIRLKTAALFVSSVALLALPTAAQADFGLLPGSVSATALNKDGTVTSQASSHPYSYTVKFKFKTDESGFTEGGKVRDIIADLPPGLVGNPLAVPRCPRRLFEGFVPYCPPNTQIGVLRVVSPSLGELRGPVSNLVAPPGTAGQLAFSIASNNALQNAFVRSEEGYGLRIGTFDIPEEVTSVTETIWGVPADPSHDGERFCIQPNGSLLEECSSGDPSLKPFLTMPSLMPGAASDHDQGRLGAEPGSFRRTDCAVARRRRQPGSAGWLRRGPIPAESIAPSRRANWPRVPLALTSS